MYASYGAVKACFLFISIFSHFMQCQNMMLPQCDFTGYGKLMSDNVGSLFDQLFGHLRVSKNKYDQVKPRPIKNRRMSDIVNTGK